MGGWIRETCFCAPMASGARCGFVPTWIIFYLPLTATLRDV